MSRTLDVAVNLTWIAPGRVGGSEEYLTRQLAGLDPTDGCRLTLYCQPSFRQAHAQLSSTYPTRVLPFGRDWRGLRIAAEHTWLVAQTRHADVVHHGGGTTPLVGRRPVVLTIHDLQYRRFPQYFSAARRHYLSAVVPRSVRRADTVATPSAFVRATVLDAFDVEPDRVVVVPHGVPDPPSPDAHDVDRTLGHHGLGDRPFVVYPAITHPHKAHQVLVEMIEHLPAPMALVLTGGAGAAEHELAAAIETSAARDRIVRTGRVSATERDVLVASASAMVFPSEYEGFGAPLVEAMAVSTPVVASDADAVREVVADAGVIVPERTGEAWADAVVRALGDRDELVERGRRRRSAFTPAASGRALAAAYRLAAGEGSDT